MLQLVRTYTQLAVEVVRWMEKQTTAMAGYGLNSSCCCYCSFFPLTPPWSGGTSFFFFSWLLLLLGTAATPSGCCQPSRFDYKIRFKTEKFLFYCFSLFFLVLLLFQALAMAGLLALLISPPSLPVRSFNQRLDFFDFWCTCNNSSQPHLPSRGILSKSLFSPTRQRTDRQPVFKTAVQRVRAFMMSDSVTGQLS